MKNRAINLYGFIAGILLLGFTGCAVTDIDRSADFHRYKTFAWGKANVDVKNPAYKSDLINRRIKTTVEKEFAKRGIALNQADPDFTVSYHTYTEKKEQQRSGGSYYGYPYFPRFYPFGGWGFPYAYGWGGPAQTYTYTEGTLIIDVTDTRTKELVWRGTVSGNVNNVSSLQRQIEKGVRAIMKKYPVTPQETAPGKNDVEVIS
jgi:hypothetical protein